MRDPGPHRGPRRGSPAASPVPSKVVVGVAPSHLVSRPRLNNRLSDGVRGPVTLVAAGPGSGKTVLLTDWASSESAPTAWVSLEASDNDPRRFWTLVGQALGAAGITAEPDSLAGLPHDPLDPSLFLAALLESVPGSAEFVLVIDDAHVLTDETVLAEIDAVIRYASPRWHLVLSSRSDPLLPLHRYRLAGQMVELRADDLAMTKGEAHALLTAHGVSLRGHELLVLTQRTEGWAAGLRLSAMSLAGSGDPERFVTALALDQGSVAEYLIEEVLNRQPEPVRRLLIHTSFFDSVTGPLAVAVTGIEDSGELLAELARSNSFVLRQREAPDRYRYHQLFGEILRHLLRREYGGRVAELLGRAAAWYEEQGDTENAMRFALQAGDWPRAAGVMVHGGFARAFVERRDVSDLGLDALLAVGSDDQTGGRPDPELRVAQAAVAVLSGQLDLSRTRLRQARMDILTADVDATATLIEVVAAQRCNALPALDRATSTLLDHHRTTDAVRGTAGLEVALRLSQAQARLWEDGPGQQLEAHLQETRAAAAREEIAGLELECLSLLQLSYAVSGRSEHAKECALRSKAIIRTSAALQRSSLHHLATAVGAYLRMDLLAAARSVRRAQQTAFGVAAPPVVAAIALMHARVLLAAGQVADAHVHLHSTPELAGALPTQLAHGRSSALAEIEVRMGRPNAALRVLAETPGGRGAPVLAVAEARAFLALGDPEAAGRALRPVLISSETTAPLPVLISAFLTSAKVAELGGDEARAVEEVLRATGLTGESLTQPFNETHALLAGLLSRHPEAEAAWPRSEAEVAPFGSPTPTTQSLAEPLTDRETAVLRRLATTMTTAEIGDELCVSVNTIKTHLAAIYRKLPAAGRRDAVARARQLELL